MRKLLLQTVLLFTAVIVPSRADFALRDGDTLAFLGDSITAARGYTKIVEHYTLMRFPDRRVRFVNAGWGGDTAKRCLARLDRDVFSKGATVVTIAVGINDIAWGTKGDEEHKRLYLDSLRAIIQRCQEKHVRPVVCSAAIADVPPDEAEKGYLQTMCDEGLAMAKSMGAETIDVQRGMREIQRRVLASNAGKKPEDQMRLHVKDGVHLSDLGHLAMAYSILKGLGAPEEVSSVEIDAATGKTVKALGCEVSDVQTSDGGFAFTRLDCGLPLNLGPFTQLNYQWIPIPDGIDGYFLRVSHLPEGDYELSADGRSLGKHSAAELAKGTNLCSATGDGWQPGGPWDAQSCVVRDLVDARDKLTAAMDQQARLLPAQADDAGEGLRMVEDDLVLQQRKAAKPHAYRFEIRKAVSAK